MPYYISCKQKLAAMLVERFRVNSPNVEYGETNITTSYTYTSTDLEQTQSGWVATPTNTEYTFKTGTKLPKLGYAQQAAVQLLGCTC